MFSQRRNKGANLQVFVTVGTTQFDQLVQTVSSLDFLQKLRKLGYSKVTFQTGRGESVPDIARDQVPGLVVEYYQFKSSIREDIESADLVISHAGAGSVLETLGAGKPLLVVINDELMGNHQTELARQLYKDGHLYYCNCSTLSETLDTANFSILKPFSPGKPEVFSNFLDKLMGFS